MKQNKAAIPPAGCRGQSYGLVLGTHNNNTIAGASLLCSGPFFNGPHYSPLSEANGSCLIWLHQ